MIHVGKNQQLIYTKNGRIYFTPIETEYDITDYTQAILAELERLKKR